MPPVLGRGGSLVRVHLVPGLRKPGNVSSVGFLPPACLAGPCSPRLLEGERGSWPVSGSVGSDRVGGVFLPPFYCWVLEAQPSVWLSFSS